MNLTRPQRRALVTFIAAGVAAVIADHYLKPQLKKGMKA